MKVAMFGTFDISNFGDILFPIVAEAMFRRVGADVTINCYSYRAKTPGDWHYPVRSIDAFEADMASTDLVLIGGGHIVHANRHMAPGYGPVDKSLPHPFAFWWLPAVAGHAAGIPVATHALSVDAAIPDWALPLYKGFATSLDYATARDDLSCDRLRQLGATNVTKVPDSVFSIGSLIQRGKHSADFEQFCEKHALKLPYLIVQPSAALRGYRADIEKLINQAHAAGWQVLELPIFQERLNRAGLFSNMPGVICASYDAHPLLLAEIIANSHGVVGISLHLSIVASVFGVPVYRKRYGAQSKFILLNELHPNIRFLEDSPPLSLDIDPVSPQIADYQRRLDDHYRHLSGLLIAPRQKSALAGAWQTYKQQPFDLRKHQSTRERISERVLMVRRFRNFIAARFAIPIDRISSLFR